MGKNATECIGYLDLDDYFCFYTHTIAIRKKRMPTSFKPDNLHENDEKNGHKQRE